MLKQANKQTALGSHGTVGTGRSGQKPREIARAQSHGKRTQGECGGKEACNIGKCEHARRR